MNLAEKFILLPDWRKEELSNCTRCNTCSLNANNSKRIFGVGDINAPMIFVGNGPGRIDVSHGVPFADYGGQLMDKIMDALGVARNEIYTTNSVLCNPGSRSPSADEISSCNNRLRNEILMLPNRRVIVALGSEAMRALFHKSSGMDKAIGKIAWSHEYHCWMICCYHPAMVYANPDLYLDFLWVIRRAMELRTIDPPPQAYKQVVETSAEGAYRVIRDLLEEARTGQGRRLYDRLLIAGDIETSGFDWQKDFMHSYGWSRDEESSYILPQDIMWHPDVYDGLREMFLEPTLAHGWWNGKFDTKFFIQEGLPAKIDHDGMLLSYALDERQGVHSLKIQARKLFWAEDYGDEFGSKFNWKDPSPEDLQKMYYYQGFDTHYTYRAIWRLRELIQEEFDNECKDLQDYPSPIELHDNLLIPTANTLRDVEFRGCRIDTEYLGQLRFDLEAQLKELSANAAALASEVNANVSENFNVGSPQQVASIMYDHLGLPLFKGTRTTDKECLETYKAKHPFVKSVLEYRNVNRLYGTYVKGFGERIRKGRIHADFFIHGTRTGRLSCHDPNLQNIPRDSIIKRIFAASEGCVFGSADFSNLEVRVAAFYSSDPNLINDLTTELKSYTCAPDDPNPIIEADLHWSVALGVFADQIAMIDANYYDEGALRKILFSHQVLLETQVKFNRHEKQNYWEPKDSLLIPQNLAKEMKKQLRFMTKFITFGILYGRGAKSLAEEELNCPVKDAERYVQNFFRRYAHLHRWMKAQQRHARGPGWIGTPMGRRRRWPLLTGDLQWKIDKQATNTPVQGLASDLNLKAGNKIHRQMVANGWGSFLFPVHDSLAFDIVEEYLEPAAELIRYEMENVVGESEVPFPIELEIGPNWGTTKTYRFQRCRMRL